MKKGTKEKPKEVAPKDKAGKKVQTPLKINGSPQPSPTPTKPASKDPAKKQIPVNNEASKASNKDGQPVKSGPGAVAPNEPVVNDQKAVADDDNEITDWAAEGIDARKDISKKYYTKDKNSTERSGLIIKLGYQMENQIGKGGFGIVKRAIKMKTNENVAIKIIDVKLKEDEKMDEERKLRRRQRRLDELRHELFTLEKVKHENIIELIEHFMIDDILYIVMEYADGGTIGDLLKEEKRPLSEGKARRWFIQSCRAVHYMHQRGFSHRDIKLANILLKRPKGIANHRICKVTDFGLSRVSWTDAKGPTMCLSYVGTVPYMAPEILEVDIANEKGQEVTPYNPMIADIWALGVCLFGMLTRSYPYNSDPKTNSKATLVQMMKDQTYKFPSKVRKKVSADVKDLVRNMLTYDVSARITFAGILTHPWIVKHESKKSKSTKKTDMNSTMTPTKQIKNAPKTEPINRNIKAPINKTPSKSPATSPKK